MKTLNTITRHLFVSNLILLQGCIIVTCLFFQSCNYNIIDYEKVFKDKKYESDKPFKMREGNIQAPLMSQKGQFNMTFDIIHGYGISMSSAISDNLYIQAGGNFLKSKSSTPTSVLVQVEEINSYNIQDPETIRYTRSVDYNLNLALENYSFFASVGKYKTFSNHGRFEYCSGMLYGNASNIYTYNFYSIDNYSFTESRKYFQYFMQSDFGYVTNKSEGALILKASCFRFFDRKFDMDYPQKDYPMENNQFVLQPAVKFGFGGIFRTYLQCGWNIPLGNSQLKWFSTNVQAGILFRINDKVKKKI